MKEASLKKNFILSTFYQVLHVLTPLITVPYISDVLLSKGVGIYSYTNSYQLYFAMFAALGTASYGSREIARNRTNKKEYSKLFWEIELMTVITTSVCLVAWFVWTIANVKYQIYYLALTPCILGVLFDISWLYIGLEQFVYTVSINSITKILSVISLFIFVKDENDVVVYTFILSFATLVGYMSMWIFLPKTVERPHFKNIRLKVHFHETLIYFIPTIAHSIYTVLDKTLIGVITQDNNENGYYENATKIINMAKALTFTALNSVLGSRISYLYAEKKHDEIKRRIDLSIDYILFVGIGITFGLIGIAIDFVPLFMNKSFSSSIILLQLLSPIIIIIGISNCLGTQYYNPAGLRSQSAKYIIIGSCVNLVFNLCLIPQLKSVGAVVATLIAESTITFLYLRHCGDVLKLRQIIQKMPKKLIAGVAMLVTILAIGQLNMRLLFRVCLEFVAGGSVYLLLLFVMNDSFMGNAKRIIKGVLKKS